MEVEEARVGATEGVPELRLWETVGMVDLGTPVDRIDRCNRIISGEWPPDLTVPSDLSWELWLDTGGKAI